MNATKTLPPELFSKLRTDDIVAAVRTACAATRRADETILALARVMAEVARVHRIPEPSVVTLTRMALRTEWKG